MARVITVDHIVVSEFNANALFTLRLSEADTLNPVTVNWDLSGLSASAGSDFTIFMEFLLSRQESYRKSSQCHSSTMLCLNWLNIFSSICYPRRQRADRQLCRSRQDHRQRRDVRNAGDNDHRLRH